MTQSGQTTIFVNDSSGNTLIRISPSGTRTYYIYGPGLLYDVEIGAGGAEIATHTYHFDMRGSTIALTDNSSQVIERMSYGPYGALASGTPATDTPFLFNGRYGVMTDPNGLLFMRARYYNPYICRFINADPAGFAGGMNFYAFADCNPISLIDPFGLGAIGENGGPSWFRQAYSTHTCMDCHGNIEILTHGVLPQDTPWFNSRGTTFQTGTFVASTLYGALDPPTGLYYWIEAQREFSRQQSQSEPSVTVGTIEDTFQMPKNWPGQRMDGMANDHAIPQAMDPGNPIITSPENQRPMPSAMNSVDKAPYDAELTQRFKQLVADLQLHEGLSESAAKAKAWRAMPEEIRAHANSVPARPMAPTPLEQLPRIR